MVASGASRRDRGFVGIICAALLLGGIGLAEAQLPDNLYLATDRSYVLGYGEPFTKVSVANPAIADVQVLSPSQLLITGKGVGSTSLLVFSGPQKIRHFTVVVHPSPLLPVSTDGASPTPHSVFVHRGERVSERLFVRDRNDLWVELGGIKADQEAPKK